MDHARKWGTAQSSRGGKTRWHPEKNGKRRCETGPGDRSTRGDRAGKALAEEYSHRGGGLFNRGVNYGRGRGLVRAGQQREEKTQRNDGFYFLGIGMDLNHIWFVDSRTAWQECGQDWVFVLRGFAVLAVNTVLLQSQCDWSVHFPTLYTASVRQKSSS